MNKSILKGLSILGALAVTGCATERVEVRRAVVVVPEPEPVVVVPVVATPPPPPPEWHYPPMHPRLPHPLKPMPAPPPHHPKPMPHRGPHHPPVHRGR